MRRAKEAAEEAESRSAPPVASFVAQCFLGPSVIPLDPALGSMRLLRLDAACRARDILRMVAATPYSGAESRRQPLIVQAALGDGTPNTSVPAMPMDGLAAQSEGFAFPYMVWVGSEEDRELALMPPWERELLERQRRSARAAEADGSGEDEETDGGRPLSVATEEDDDGNGKEEFAAIETAAAEEVGDNGSTGLAIQSPEPGPLTPVDPLRSPGAKPPPTPASAAQRRLKRQRREEERRRREALAAKREAALKAKEEARKGTEAEARRVAAERERAFEEQRAADRTREIVRAERRDESKAAIIRDKAVQHSKRESRLSDIKRRYDAAITSGNAPAMGTPSPGLTMSPSAWMQSVRHTGPSSAHRDEDDPETATDGTPGVSDLLPSAHRSRGLYGDSVDPAIAALDASVEASAKAAVEQQLRDKEVLRANVQDEYLKHLVKVNTQRKAAVKRDARTRAAEALHQVEFVGANSSAKGHAAAMM
jgi:hypothetical protein